MEQWIRWNRFAGSGTRDGMGWSYSQSKLLARPTKEDPVAEVARTDIDNLVVRPPL